MDEGRFCIQDHLVSSWLSYCQNWMRLWTCFTPDNSHRLKAPTSMYNQAVTRVTIWFVLHTLGGIRKSYKNHTEIFEAPNHPTGPTGPTSLSVPYLAAQRLMWSMFERCQRNFDTSWDLHLTHQLPTNALEFFKKNVHSYHQPLNKQIGGRKPCNHLGCAHVVNPSWPYNSTIGEHEP